MTRQPANEDGELLPFATLEDFNKQFDNMTPQEILATAQPTEFDEREASLDDEELLLPRVVRY